MRAPDIMTRLRTIPFWLNGALRSVIFQRISPPACFRCQVPRLASGKQAYRRCGTRRLPLYSMDSDITWAMRCQSVCLAAGGCWV